MDLEAHPSGFQYAENVVEMHEGSFYSCGIRNSPALFVLWVEVLYTLFVVRMIAVDTSRD